MTRHLVQRFTAVALVLGGSVSILAQPPTTTREPGAHPATASASARLPVRRVVLYKSGVGYFEHVGRVVGDQAVSIDLTSGQLNDVLKSLTTVDLGNGRVTRITFDTAAPLAERLRTLSLPLDAQATPLDVFRALRGTRVDVQTASTTSSGRVLSAIERTRVKDGASESYIELSIVTESGAVRVFELTSGVSVRVAEADRRGELGRYLDAVQSSDAANVRRLQIATSGTGARELFVSYISEVPVWKTTYRLVIPKDRARQPFLQGWAIVDNTLGEDWTDVQLSLAAGAPQSFVQQLSAPLYTRRPVVPLPSATLLTPQAHDGTLETSERQQLKSAVPGGAGRGTAGALPAPAPAPATAETIGDYAEAVMVTATPEATGQALGELFEYALDRPITIRRNESALVPILQSAVAVERVSLWSAADQTPRPRRALWITNDTGATLDAGSLTLLEDGAFAGESLIDAVAPQERRLVSYAADLEARVSATRDSSPRRVSRVRIGGGALVQVTEDRTSATYTIRNEDDEPRVFVIEHPRDHRWTLLPSTPKPTESTASVHRFSVTVPAHASQELRVDERREVETRVAAGNITSEHVALVLRGHGQDANDPRLRALMTQAGEVSRLAAGVRERQAETTRITEDQARVRENLKALKGSTEERQLVARYVQQLDTQEDRLVVLRREIEEIQQQRAAAVRELERLTSAMSLDVEIP